MGGGAGKGKGIKVISVQGEKVSTKTLEKLVRGLCGKCKKKEWREKGMLAAMDVSPKREGSRKLSTEGDSGASGDPHKNPRRPPGEWV